MFNDLVIMPNNTHFIPIGMRHKTKKERIKKQHEKLAYEHQMFDIFSSENPFNKFLKFYFLDANRFLFCLLLFGKIFTNFMREIFNEKSY